MRNNKTFELLRLDELGDATRFASPRIMRNDIILDRNILRREIHNLRDCIAVSRDESVICKLQSCLVEHEKDLRMMQRSLECCLGNASKEIFLGNFKIVSDFTTWTGNKAVQEDRMLNLSKVEGIPVDVFFCGIFDGHCGSSCADFLTGSFPSVFARHINFFLLNSVHAHHGEPELSHKIVKALRESIGCLEEDFLSLSAEEGRPDGSTLLVIVFFNEGSLLKCATAHLGDSRALLGMGGRNDGGDTVIRLTDDHKPDREDERMWAEKQGALVNDYYGVWRVFTPDVIEFEGRKIQWGLAVSRAVGDLPMKIPNKYISSEPEISVYDLLSSGLDDSCVVVLGCDGIFDVLSDSEVVSQAMTRDSSSAVVEKAYVSLSDDNLTCGVLKIKVIQCDRHENVDNKENENAKKVFSSSTTTLKENNNKTRTSKRLKEINEKKNGSRLSKENNK